jgi:hypothetical protein
MNECGVFGPIVRLKAKLKGLPHFNCIGGVKVSGLSSSVVDRGFEPRSGKTKDCNWHLLLLH